MEAFDIERNDMMQADELQFNNNTENPNLICL